MPGPRASQQPILGLWSGRRGGVVQMDVLARAAAYGRGRWKASFMNLDSARLTGDAPHVANRFSQVGRLLGRQRRRVAGLAIASLASGLTESVILAILAEAAAALAAANQHVRVN